MNSKTNSSFTNIFSHTVFGIYQILGQWKHQILFTVFGFSSHCKHSPTCSRYTQAEMKRHGTIVGLIKGFFRLLTCW